MNSDSHSIKQFNLPIIAPQKHLYGKGGNFQRLSMYNPYAGLFLENVRNNNFKPFSLSIYNDIHHSYKFSSKSLKHLRSHTYKTCDQTYRDG